MAVVATMLIPQHAAYAHTVTFSPFATICPNSANGGLAYQASRNRFIVQCGGLLWSVDATTGGSTPFAQSCGLPSFVESSIAISTGLGGFPADFIYVAQGSTIFQIDPTGTACVLFANIGGGFIEKAAITFDYNSTAPFLNQLVAVKPNGDVVRVDSSGSTITPIASIGIGLNLFEDAVVAPPTFPGGLADQILTAAEFGGAVFAISSGGVVTFVASVRFSPDSLCILPPTILTAGAPNGIFSVQSDSLLYQAPASSFSGFGNNIVIGPENGGEIYTIDPSPAGFPKPVTIHPAVVGSSATCPSGNCFEQQMVCIVEKCPLTQGFWKNHPAAWPVSSLTLGGQTYTQPQLLTILNTATTGDASLILARQLIAALLNIANGSNPAQISSIITTADTLLIGCNLNLGPGCSVSPASTAGQAMVAAASVLDTYNNGQFTPNCQH